MFTKKDISSQLQKIQDTLDNFLPYAKDAIVTLVAKVTGLDAKVTGLDAKVTGLMQELKEQRALIQQLVNEVCRVSHSDGTLMVSMFAFTRQEEIWCTQQDMAYNSKRARRQCLRKGITFERIEDPRYGYVLVFPREALEAFFCDDESQQYIGWEKAPKQTNGYDINGEDK